MTPLSKLLDALALAAMVAMFAGLLFLTAALDGDAWRYLPETTK